MSDLNEWDSFYVIVGSAGGALIGLQFVVMTLIADRPVHDVARAGAAFATPTIVHFSSVLFLSAILRAPWQTAAPLPVLLGLTGLAGVVYTANVVLRMRAQTAYKPDFEDWFCHVLVPVAAYATLALAALATHPHEG